MIISHVQMEDDFLRRRGARIASNGRRSERARRWVAQRLAVPGSNPQQNRMERHGIKE